MIAPLQEGADLLDRQGRGAQAGGQGGHLVAQRSQQAVQPFSGGVRPWRMGTEDYVSAVRADGLELRGADIEPRWDPELGAAMRRHGRAVHEESVLAGLLHSLGAVRSE